MHNPTLILSFFLLCPTVLIAQKENPPKPTPTPSSTSAPTPAKTIATFPLYIAGKPNIDLSLDREYTVYEVTDKEAKKKCIAYALDPKDHQSALVVAIGEDAFVKSDEDIAKEPGFTSIKREAGEIAGQKVIWRRWSDENHLYSDCTVRIPPSDANGSNSHFIYLNVIANTPERRKALEGNLNSIKLTQNPKEVKKLSSQ